MEPACLLCLNQAASTTYQAVRGTSYKQFIVCEHTVQGVKLMDGASHVVKFKLAVTILQPKWQT